MFDFNEKDKRQSEVFHNFEEEKEVIGILVKIEDGQFGKMYKINSNGKTILVGSFTALHGKINDTDINKPIKIVCKGDVKGKKGGRIYKDFDVYIKQDK